MALRLFILHILFVLNTLNVIGQKKEKIFLKGGNGNTITLKQIKNSGTVLLTSDKGSKILEDGIFLWSQGFPNGYTYSRCMFNKPLPFFYDGKILNRIKVGTKITIFPIEFIDSESKKKIYYEGITYEVVK
ncbi:hypothetical protein [Ferruginibacter profundus]